MCQTQRKILALVMGKPREVHRLVPWNSDEEGAEEGRGKKVLRPYLHTNTIEYAQGLDAQSNFSLQNLNEQQQIETKT